MLKERCHVSTYRSGVAAAVILTIVGSFVGCSFAPGEIADPVANATDPVEFADHIRVSLSGRFVEFDGIVPLDAHDAETPDVYLELIACSPDTREHESLVMTRASPSLIHAALLSVGLTSGSPGSWRREADGFVPVVPTGDAVNITITYTSQNGSPVVADVQSWVVDRRSGREFAGAQWIFAGSRIVEFRGREHYDADGSGTVIGLTTFGSEVIAWGDVISHQASIHEPSWIANAASVPAQGTAVVVRMTAVDAKSAR